MPLFRATYEPLLKRNPDLRRIYEERRRGRIPTDEDWLRVIWLAVFPVTLPWLTDGHVRSFLNGMDRLRDCEQLQRVDAGYLKYDVHFFTVRVTGLDDRRAVVPWCVEAALFVLDLLRDEVKVCLEATTRHHRVPSYPSERRRRRRNLSKFSYDRFLEQGFEHLALQTDLRIAQPPSCMWALPMLVETMLEIPPHVRRVWAERERLAVGAPALSDAWGHHYARDVIEQLPLTLARRIVDDGYSRHPLAAPGAVADVDAIEREWATVGAAWSLSHHAMPEPTIRRESLYRLVGEVNSNALGRAALERAHRLLDDMANWVLVRLVGVNGPSRIWIDRRARRECEVLLGVLVRRHLARVDAADWTTAYDSNGTTGSPYAREQHAAIWLDLEGVGFALDELAQEATFRATIAKWNPATRNCDPTTLLLKRARKIKERLARGGIAASEVILNDEASTHATTDAAAAATHANSAPTATDTGDELDEHRLARLRSVRELLGADDSKMLDAMLAGDMNPDEMPGDLRARLHALVTSQ